MSIECERKYLDVNFTIFRQNLIDISASYEGTSFESNSVWENKENSLMSIGVLLRLRTIKWFSEKKGIPTLQKILNKEDLANFFQKYKGDIDVNLVDKEKDVDVKVFDRIEHVLTWKNPAYVLDNCKMREELELNVADTQIMQQIFWGTGLKIHACYEKIRETWVYNDVHITLDLLPFIEVVELEGHVQNIDEVANILHISKMKTSTASYHALHQAWRKQYKLEPDNNFVFNLSQHSSIFL